MNIKMMMMMGVCVIAMSATFASSNADAAVISCPGEGFGILTVYSGTNYTGYSHEFCVDTYYNGEASGYTGIDLTTYIFAPRLPMAGHVKSYTLTAPYILEDDYVEGDFQNLSTFCFTDFSGATDVPDTTGTCAATANGIAMSNHYTID